MRRNDICSLYTIHIIPEAIVVVLLLVLLEGQEVHNHKAGIHDKYRLLLNPIKGTVQRDLTWVQAISIDSSSFKDVPLKVFFQILFSCPFVRYIKPFSVTNTKKVAFFVWLAPN
jgi:hypothetical protein